MIYKEDSKWTDSKAKNSSQKIFIERWLELSHRFTIDIYRARFHNTHTILKELLELIDIIREFNLPLQHLKWVAEEATSLLRNDPIIKDIIPAYTALIKELNNNSYWNGKEPLPKIEVFLRSFVHSLDQVYLKNLIDSLREKISNNENELVLKIAELIGSECIFLEFNTKDLERIGESFLTQSDSSFEERLNNFIKRISKTSITYKVLIRFEAFYQDKFPDKISNILIKKNLEPRTKDRYEVGYLTGGDYTWFAHISVDAKDAFIAGIKGAQELGIALDIYSYGFPLDKIDIHPNAIVYFDGGGFKKVDTRPLIPGYVQSDMDWFDSISGNLTTIYGAERISKTTKDKIRSSLRYIRQGRAAVNIEEKFMNFWIALEFLLRVKGYRYILDSVIEFAPKVLSLYYPRRLIRDLIENINRLKISYSTNIREKLDENREFQKKETCMISILRNNQDKKDLLDSCKSSPLLQYRISKLAEKFYKSEEIWKMTNLNTQNIEWHLARIYRLRNRIVHGAEYNLLIDHLSSNVIAYVTEILNAIIYQLSKRGEWNSIDDLLFAYVQTYNIWMVRLQKDKNNDIPLDEIIDPLETLLPKC